MRLFTDTATSDLWHHEHGAKDDVQPHMTRLTWSLEDNSETIDHASVLIKLPPGAKIADGAARFTGIYAQNLEDTGVNQYSAMERFCWALAQADEIIGFAMAYQKKVLEREMRKPDEHGHDRMHEVTAGGIKHVGIPSVWPTEVCVQRLLAPILGLGWSANRLPSFDEASEAVVLNKIPQRGLKPEERGLLRLEHIRYFYQHATAAGRERLHA